MPSFGRADYILVSLQSTRRLIEASDGFMELATLNRAAKRGVSAVQQYALISGRALGNLVRRPFYGADIITQADIIGVGSIPIVILTGVFTGGVLAFPDVLTVKSRLESQLVVG